MNKTLWQLIVVAVMMVIGIVVFFSITDLKTIKGSEVGVKEDWYTGVQNEPLRPGTYFVKPWETVQVYSTALRVFTMNDKDESAHHVVGRGSDSYLVQSEDSQDLHLSLQIQWRIDPAHVIEIHKNVGPINIEENLLRPTLLRTVKDEATTRKAIDAYSGPGLVKLQQDIEKKLNDESGELARRGVIIDSFVIEHIRLDNDYVKEITARQIAMQKELRAKQEEKAATAEAAKAKAVAQAAYETAVVKAEQDKQVQVLKAEADNEQEILKAEAEKKKVVLAAEGLKESGELKAASILAIGEAEAKAKQLELAAYSADGADNFVRIQVAESMGKAFSNIKGYLPENMQVFTLGESFQQAVENVVKGKPQK